MRCPACGADNPADTKKCASCGERINRRPRRQELFDQSDSPFVRRPDSRNRTALLAYRYAVFSLIPFLGLLLGPIAMIIAFIAWRQEDVDPENRQTRHSLVAFFLGLATFCASAVGLFLIIKALTSNSPQ